MRVEFNKDTNNTGFGKNLYINYKKDLFGRKDIFFANIIEMARPQLERLTTNADRYKDCDMFISANRKGTFRILVGDNLSSPIRRWLPDPESTIKVKFSAADIHKNYIVDELIRYAEEAKTAFHKIPNYFTKA